MYPRLKTQGIVLCALNLVPIFFHVKGFFRNLIFFLKNRKIKTDSFVLRHCCDRIIGTGRKNTGKTMIKYSLDTQSHEELIDITSQVQEAVLASQASEGICTVFVPHTTAGVTINENADATVKEDILMALTQVVPSDLPYGHSEGNSPSHVKASLLGSSISVILAEGRLQLGTWQGIFFCEFDGPRHRRFFVHISG